MKRLHLLFAALLLWCGVLLTIRIERAHSLVFAFLFWNLFLAAIPYVASVVLDALSRARRAHAMQAVAFVVWLLFLPNAPYILTDFIHLRPRDPIPLWYDLLLIASCAGTGLLLGYASTLLVHRVADRRFGRIAGWSIALVCTVLSAFGVYLGRFLRFNSWEAITDPIPLFADIAHRLMNPLAYPKTFVVTALFGVMLTLGYVALHVMAESAREER